MTIKFSELEDKDLVVHDGEIICAKIARERIMQGIQAPMYTLTREYIQLVVLSSTNIDKTSPMNNGLFIEIDIENEISA
ncbi:hypothetical protein [Jeotgalibacillus soli]|uniref:Uncharacterized protein n=1 Tax=Jeotgalibacillus soli TaxID=889306 RepID=A0A0C2VJD6_9BACL|nr:hypothetical protein [Jeotgalibacillus soli]KIL44103.1 hypothetical protein KP78_30670 [Jeotgalibacillus soli]